LPSYIRNQLVSLKPDVVHIHGEFNPDNLRVPTLFRCPILLTPHGAFHPAVLSKGKRGLKSFYIALAKYLLYKKVVFHALTPMEEGHITRVLPGAKVYCVPQGASVQIETLLANGDHCKLSSNGIQFLFVGRLDVYTKGLDLLLEAFGEAVRRLQGQEISLTLVGPDWNKSALVLEKQAEAVGISRYVSILGTKTGSDLVRLFGQSHIYIHVSRHEGHPLAVTEALLFRKPAILTNTIGTISYPEISSLPHVILVPPKVDSIADAIINAIRCFDDLQASARETHTRVREFFSWDKVAALHLRAYEKFCHVDGTC
jgi:glycosyltransferase involved in cell wall biosynthesis